MMFDSTNNLAATQIKGLVCHEGEAPPVVREWHDDSWENNKNSSSAAAQQQSSSTSSWLAPSPASAYNSLSALFCVGGGPRVAALLAEEELERSGDGGRFDGRLESRFDSRFNSRLFDSRFTSPLDSRFTSPLDFLERLPSSLAAITTSSSSAKWLREEDTLLADPAASLGGATIEEEEEVAPGPAAGLAAASAGGGRLRADSLSSRLTSRVEDWFVALLGAVGNFLVFCPKRHPSWKVLAEMLHAAEEQKDRLRCEVEEARETLRDRVCEGYRLETAKSFQDHLRYVENLYETKSAILESEVAARDRRIEELARDNARLRATVEQMRELHVAQNRKILQIKRAAAMSDSFEEDLL